MKKWKEFILFIQNNKAGVIWIFSLLLYCLIYQFLNILQPIFFVSIQHFLVLLYDLSMAAIIGLVVYYATTYRTELCYKRKELSLINEYFTYIRINFYCNCLNKFGFNDYPITQVEVDKYISNYNNRSAQDKLIFNILAYTSLIDCFSNHIKEIGTIISISNPLYDVYKVLKIQPFLEKTEKEICPEYIIAFSNSLQVFDKILKKELVKYGINKKHRKKNNSLYSWIKNKIYKYLKYVKK